MALVEAIKVKANLCRCGKSSGFSVWGPPELFTHNSGDINLVLPVIRRYPEQPKILDSVVVVCACDNTTVHFCGRFGQKLKWKSRALWKGWRKRIKLHWVYKSHPEGGSLAPRMLRNISWIDICDNDSVVKRITFVNTNSGSLVHAIHKKQLKTAEEIFNELLYSKTAWGFKQNIDYRIRDIADASAQIAEGFSQQLDICKEILEAAREELFNLKGISQSKRLKGLRLALEKACKDAGITLPELLQESDTPPEFITQLLAA